MTMKQTCCPFCHSAFYVTTLQLNAYKGQARCGQCHQVFDALANLIAKDAPVTASANTDAESTDTLADATPDTDTAESSVDTAPVRHIVDTAKEDSHTVILAKNFRSVAPEEKQAVVTATLTGNTDVEDEMLFSDDQGIDSDDTEINDKAVQTESQNLSSSILLDDTFDQQFLNDGIESKKDLFEKQDGSVEKLHHAADDSWIEDLLKEEEAAEKAATAAAAKSNTPPEAHDSAYTEPFSEPKRPAYISEHEEDLLSYLNRTGVTRSLVSEAPASIAEQKPASHRILQPSTQTYSSSYVLGWLFMIALMFGLLVSQFIYFNFEALAINPKTADKVEKMCGILRCNIPYMNAKELKLKNLKVVGTASGYTTFSASMVNTAKLSQPFPALKLSLKRNGEIVASQVIQPRQYLPEELKTLTRLATKTPYPIEFTIKKRRSEIKDFSLQPSFK